MRAYRTRLLFVTYHYTSYGCTNTGPLKTEGFCNATFNFRHKGKLSNSDIADLTTFISERTKHDHIVITNYQFM